MSRLAVFDLDGTLVDSVDDLAASVNHALAAWHVHYEAHCLDRTRVYPGLEAALAAAGRPLAVLTNKPGPLARKILAGLGLLPRFTEVVGGGDAPRKPDPAGLLGLLARAGAAPADALLIGDSTVDVETGRAAGVRVVAVTWGFVRPAALRASGATALVDRPEQLAPYLR